MKFLLGLLIFLSVPNSLSRVPPRTAVDFSNRTLDNLEIDRVIEDCSGEIERNRSKRKCSGIIKTFCTELMGEPNFGKYELEGHFSYNIETAEEPNTTRFYHEAVFNYISENRDRLSPKLLEKYDDIRFRGFERGDISEIQKDFVERAFIRNGYSLEDPPEAQDEKDRLFREGMWDFTNSVFPNQTEKLQWFFDEAKKSIIKVLDSEEIENRDELKRIVQDIELLPPIDIPPEIPDCAYTEDNAFYNMHYNAVSICLGRLIAYQNPVTLYTDLLHEIAHSIAPRTQMDRKLQNSDYYQDILSAMASISSDSMSCSEWQKFKRKNLQIPNLASPPSEPFQKLSDCLNSREHLRDWDKEELIQSARQSAELRIAKTMLDRPFSLLTRPNRLPEPLDERLTDDLEMYLFDREYHCSNEQNLPKRFEESIESTKELLALHFLNTYEICGRNCPGERADGFFETTEEMIADWFVHKGFDPFFKEDSNPTTMRFAIEGYLAPLCKSQITHPIDGDDQKLYEIEARFINRQKEDQYASDWHRALSFFTPRVQELFGCTLDYQYIPPISACNLDGTRNDQPESEFESNPKEESNLFGEIIDWIF